MATKPLDSAAFWRLETVFTPPYLSEEILPGGFPRGQGARPGATKRAQIMDEPVQLTLWRQPELWERALAVLATARAEIRDLRKGNRTTANGRKRTIDRLERVAQMDENLIKREMRVKGQEERMWWIALYELIDRPLAQLDRECDWPAGTAWQMKSTQPELFDKMFFMHCRRVTKKLAKHRTTEIANIMAETSTARKVLAAHMAGTDYEGHAVKESQARSAKAFLQLFKELEIPDEDLGAALEDERPVDAADQAVEDYAAELGDGVN